LPKGKSALIILEVKKPPQARKIDCCRKRKKKKINKNYWPQPVSNIFFLDVSFSKECACESTKAAYASFAFVTAAAPRAYAEQDRLQWLLKAGQ